MSQPTGVETNGIGRRTRRHLNLERTMANVWELTATEVAAEYARLDVHVVVGLWSGPRRTRIWTGNGFHWSGESLDDAP